jgi:iron complex outermembrane recepter protein
MKAINPNLFRKTAIALGLSFATAPSMAQLVLEEVVVTAQKRESTLQEISGTVNVVTADSIQRYSSLDFDDLESQISGVSLTTPNSRAPNIAVRGVAIDPESGADGTVDVYWNGQFVNLSIAFSQLYDLERIEILRGPQGSLQGRSSPGGAINVLTTKASTDEASGYIQVTGAENDALNAQFAYGAPIIDGVLGMRIAAVYDTDENGGVENLNSGLDSPDSDVATARFSTTWNVTDSFTAEVTYQYYDAEEDDPFSLTGTDSLGMRPSLAADDNKALAENDNLFDFDFDMVNLKLAWELEDHELVYVGGWSDQTREYLEENDRADYVTAAGALTHQSSITDQEMESHELRFNSTGNDTWDYMIGLYYQDQDVVADFTANTTTLLPPSTPVIGAYDFTLTSNAVLPVTAEQWSIFTFHNFYLTDSLQLDVGLRYTDYDKGREATVNFVDMPYLPDIEGLDPDFNQVVLDGLTDQATAAFPIEGISEENQDLTEDAWTGSISLRYDLTDDLSVYAGYYRGYRSSGTSIVPSPDVQFLPMGGNELLHDEEESDAVEIGFKGKFLDNRASLNGSFYYQEYDGYLGFARGVEVLDNNGVPKTLPGGWIYNGDATTYGAEFDGQILLGDTWSAGGSLSWNIGEWDDAEEPCNQREAGEVYGLCNVDGENIGGEPEWSASLHSEYYVPMGEREVYIRGLYKFTGERDNISASAGIGNVAEELSSYSVVNMFFGVRSVDASWDANIFVKNMFDADDIIQQLGPDQYDQQVSGGSYTRTSILEERTVGVMGRYNF